MAASTKPAIQEKLRRQRFSIKSGGGRVRLRIALQVFDALRRLLSREVVASQKDQNIIRFGSGFQRVLILRFGTGKVFLARIELRPTLSKQIVAPCDAAGLM